MEEDIKKLEKYLKGDKIYDTELDNALKNLIARNRELEYKLREHICIEAHEQVKQLYIPKSKVREKIEEYNKMIVATYQEFTHQADVRRDNCVEIRNILLELLEE